MGFLRIDKMFEKKVYYYTIATLLLHHIRTPNKSFYFFNFSL